MCKSLSWSSQRLRFWEGPSREAPETRTTHHNDLVTQDLELRLAEVTKSSHGCERCTVEQVTGVRKEVERQAQVPDLESVCQSSVPSHAMLKPTFSPATIHNASRSTASVLLMLFSSNRVIMTSSSDAL